MAQGSEIEIYGKDALLVSVVGAQVSCAMSLRYTDHSAGRRGTITV